MFQSKPTPGAGANVLLLVDPPATVKGWTVRGVGVQFVAVNGHRISGGFAGGGVEQDLCILRAFGRSGDKDVFVSRTSGACPDVLAGAVA